MGGAFSFIIGVLSLGGAAGIEARSRAQAERDYQEELANGYDFSTQVDYDYGFKGNLERILLEYDYTKIKEAIEKDFPNMSETNIHRIICLATRKRWMESESPYKYKIPERFELVNVDKYADDKFKRSEYKGG